MAGFCGAEPLVGEIAALRTFRVDESGLLLPLYSAPAWYDGTNTAVCAPPTGEESRAPHRAPHPDCECGFYAYGSEQAAARTRQMRYVQAVVSCWGTVLAGTAGIRAEHARIDAIWLHPNVPRWVQRRVAASYPSARIYSDRVAMLAEHPLSALDCYREQARPAVLPRAAVGLLLAGVVALGGLPVSVLHRADPLWLAWLSAVAAVAALALWLWVGAHGLGHRAAALVAAGLLAWLLAPLCGLPGWLLRVPLLRALAVAAGGYLLSLRPGFFPVERVRRERAFCGVRA